VIAEQQRADPAFARALAFGEATDDKFLALDAFRFLPVANTARPISRRGALRHDAFEAALSRLFENRVARTFDMVGITQRVRLGSFWDQRTQQFLAFEQPCAAQILAVEIEQIESDQRQLLIVLLAQRLLQIAEIRTALG